MKIERGPLNMLIAIAAFACIAMLFHYGEFTGDQRGAWLLSVALGVAFCESAYSAFQEFLARRAGGES